MCTAFEYLILITIFANLKLSNYILYILQLVVILVSLTICSAFEELCNYLLYILQLNIISISLTICQLELNNFTVKYYFNFLNHVYSIWVFNFDHNLCQLGTE